jgi:hypothetical protein
LTPVSQKIKAARKAAFILPQGPASRSTKACTTVAIRQNPFKNRIAWFILNAGSCMGGKRA